MSVSPGRDRETGTLDTANSVALAVTWTFATGGNARQAQAVTQSIYNANPFGDHLDGEHVELRRLNPALR